MLEKGMAFPETWTVHKHKYSVVIVTGFSQEFPNDYDEDEVVAICNCGDKLNRLQIEAVLNHDTGIIGV